MGTWDPQSDTQKRNIPATAGTYNSVPYYIGLLKNGELNTPAAISDFTITKQYDWIKNVQLTKSQNGDYYQLTYEVDENTDTSPRSCIITVNHKPANKNLSYSITQSANTTQEPTKPTVYDFTAVYTGINLDDAQSYSLKVNNYSVGSENGPFESINAGDQLNSEQLEINITMIPPTTVIQSELYFEFKIMCNYDYGSTIFNSVSNEKEVDIMLTSGANTNIGSLKINSADDLEISIRIFESLNQFSGELTAELSEAIIGTININSDIIPFVVRFGFG